ncbi:hypothetical protein CGCSCA1_v014681 [Colletotrichum siamense]|nr:hypothetical protein CGCSCA1_v014681 [Colletotrichum siamense]
MAHRRLWRCLAFSSLIVCAQAGALDDFTNNLFSDLAPVLALFGERATMQFMSQSLGWADCIALAMAPLGIITIIVSAIRVGGPMRLKAIIGRAKENTSVAEMELMSSTSREVCELYNGESIVRCQGLAPVWEYICLIPRHDNKIDSVRRNDQTGRRIQFKTLEQAIKDGFLKLEGSVGLLYHVGNILTVMKELAILSWKCKPNLFRKECRPPFLWLKMDPMLVLRQCGGV